MATAQKIKLHSGPVDWIFKNLPDFIRHLDFPCLSPGFMCHVACLMHYDLTEALAALPHGTAFRFVDELLALEPGVEACAVYRVKGDEAFLEGHFPDNPLMPGVILIEAIAQLGGVVIQTDPDYPKMDNLRLTGVRAAKILGAALPGHVLQIRAKVEGRMGGLAQLEGEVTGPHGTLATARITLSGTMK